MTPGDRESYIMATRTAIEWTEVTWNPTTGCDRISAGCDNCYALTLAKRLKAMGQAKYQNDGDPRTSGPGFGITVHPGVKQVLTKRSARLRKIAGKLDWPPNLWMGVSVEDASQMPRVDDLRTVPAAVRFLSCEPLLGPLDGLDLAGIGWVIAGGESGPAHRPLDPSWVTGIRDRCEQAGVPFFFKQWGGRTPKEGGRELDGRLWDQMPALAAV